MTQQANQIPGVLTIDGVQYEVEKFSDRIKNLLGIYQKWEQETIDAKLVFAKSEAALRDLTREISELVKAEAAEQTQEPVLAEEKPKRARKAAAK